MTALYIILGILGVLILLLLLPIGVKIRYEDKGLRVQLLIGPVHYQIYPGKRKEKKEKVKAEGKPKAPKKGAGEKKEMPRKGGKLSELKKYIPTAMELLNAIRKRLVLRKLTLLVNLAGDDPCDLALDYGKANGAIGSGMALLEQAFRVKKRDVQVFCDFLAVETEVYLDMEITGCTGRLLGVLIRYGLKLLKIFLNEKSDKAV